MGAATNTWLIPYPLGTDRMCDGYLFTQDMAERVDEILDVFDVDLARTQVIPLARVSVSVSQVTTDAVPAPTFTTVDFDTTGLVDMNQPATPIRVEDDQFFIAGGLCLWTEGSGVAGDLYGLDIAFGISGSVLQFAWYQRDAGGGSIMRSTVAGFERALTPDLLALFPSHSGTNGNRTVSSARLWIMKVADL